MEFEHLKNKSSKIDSAKKTSSMFLTSALPKNLKSSISQPCIMVIIYDHSNKWFLLSSFLQWIFLFKYSSKADLEGDRDNPHKPKSLVQKNGVIFPSSIKWQIFGKWWNFKLICNEKSMKNGKFWKSSEASPQPPQKLCHGPGYGTESPSTTPCVSAFRAAMPCSSPNQNYGGR